MLIAGILTGLATTLTFIILMYRFGIDFFLRHKGVTDLAMFAFCFFVMAGTATGIISAIVAGLSFSFGLNLVDKIEQYKKLKSAKTGDYMPCYKTANETMSVHA